MEPVINFLPQSYYYYNDSRKCHGPYKAITDEEGHLFPRNELVEVCTDTAAKLNNPPYTGQFTILNTDDENAASYSCSPSEEEGAPCC
jgi:hypothetical protein